MHKTVYIAVSLTLLFIFWVYNSFFQSLFLSILAGTTAGYIEIRKIIDSFDFFGHALNQLSKLGLEATITEFLAKISTYAVLLFPVGVIYMLFVLLRHLNSLRTGTLVKTRLTYLKDGTLNPKRRNIDRLSEEHPWKRGKEFKRKGFFNVPLILTVVLIIAAILLALSFVNEFNFGNKKVPSKEIDKRAVSVLRGTITHVRDGDTFEVNGTAVRISALDCPENSTSEGKKATRFAKKFKGKQAICELTGAKTYDRVVGYCSINGQDFARTMVENTSCEFWQKYDVWDRY